jgi:hypothetical protein
MRMENDSQIKQKLKNYKHGEFDSGNSKNAESRTPLKLMERNYIVDNFLGEYPVIFIDLEDVKGGTFEEIEHKLKIQISEAFK